MGFGKVAKEFAKGFVDTVKEHGDVYNRLKDKSDSELKKIAEDSSWFGGPSSVEKKIARMILQKRGC